MNNKYLTRRMAGILQESELPHCVQIYCYFRNVLVFLCSFGFVLVFRSSLLLCVPVKYSRFKGFSP